MKKYSQYPYGMQYQAPMTGMVPGMMPTTQMPVSAPVEVQKYKGLSTPEDILNDYGIKEKLKEGEGNDEMAKEIWEMYGGDPKMIETPKIGEWPEEEPKNIDPKFVEQKFKETENKKLRYKRLKEDTSINDIFEKGDKEISRYISWYASSEGLTKATPPGGVAGGMGGGLLAHKNPSWYKLANLLNE